MNDQNVRSYREVSKFSVKYYFKVMEIIFKLVSWLLIVIAFRVFSAKLPDNTIMKLFTLGLHIFYFLGLSTMINFLISCDRQDLELPQNTVGTFWMVIIKVFSVLFFSSYLVLSFNSQLDDLIDQIIRLQVTK